MAEGWLIDWVLVVIFVARLIRSAFGFSEALVAVPLLALLMPVEVAAPLAVFDHALPQHGLGGSVVEAHGGPEVLS